MAKLCFVLFLLLCIPDKVKGCSRVTDIDFDKDAVVKADPGNCYTFCGAQYEHIGLSGTRCYCIPDIDTEKVNMKQRGCKSRCKNQRAVLCGAGDGHVSIYTKAEYFNNEGGREDNDEYFCLALETKERQFFWSSCSNRYLSHCDQEVQTKGRGNIWSTAMRRCLGGGILPAFKSSHWLHTNGGYLWIGEIRSQVIKPLSVMTGSSKEIDRKINQGYIEVRDGKFVLQFDKVGERLHAMCLKETTTTPELPSTMSTSGSSIASSTPLKIEAFTELTETTTTPKRPSTMSTSRFSRASSTSLKKEAFTELTETTTTPELPSTMSTSGSSMASSTPLKIEAFTELTETTTTPKRPSAMAKSGSSIALSTPLKKETFTALTETTTTPKLPSTMSTSGSSVASSTPLKKETFTALTAVAVVLITMFL